MAEAVRTDGGALARIRLQENGAINDRTMACEMGGPQGSFAPPPTPIIDLTDDADERIMGRLATINVSLSRPIDLSPRPRLTLGQQLRQNQCSSIDTSTSTDVETVLGIKKRCASCNDEVPFFSAGKVFERLTNALMWERS